MRSPRVTSNRSKVIKNLCDKHGIKITTGSKMGNKITVIDGIKFRSKKEADRYCVLKVLEKSKAISDLKLQVSFELVPSQIIQGKKKRPICYVADFVYIENGVKVVEDVKGAITEIYRIKRHLMKYAHGIDILET